MSTDPHVAWSARRKELTGWNCTPTAEELAEAARLRDLICYTRAETLAGVHEQLVMLCDAVRACPDDQPFQALHHAVQTVGHLNALEIVRQRDWKPAA
jgi:hypothetical protein